MEMNPVKRLQAGHDEIAKKATYLPQFQKVLDEKHQEMLAILNRVESQKADIQADKNLSAEGKKNARAAVGEAGKKEMAAIRAKILPGLAEHKASLLRKMDEKKVRPDNLYMQLRQREIRDCLRALSMQDRAEIYLRACAQDDFETYEAIEETPKAFALMDEKIVEGARMDRFAKKFPADAAIAENLERLHFQIDALCALNMRRCEV